MKKLLYVVSALAALTLLAPSVGFAVQADNQVGIYGDAIASDGSQNFVVPTSTPFTAYMILTQPVDNYGVDVIEVEAFECAVTFSNGAMVFKLAETLPPQAINVGDSSNPAAGLQYAVGLGVPMPVNNGTVTLVQFTFMVLVDTNIDVFIEESVGGNMYFQDTPNKELVDYYPSSSSPAMPVASFNGTAVPVDSESWGGVKAMYR
jgi:hypothetical protein